MLFFDLDGTLLDSNGIWLDIDIEFLGRHGIAPVPEDYTEYVTHHSPLDAARYTRTRFGLSETAEEIRQTWLQMARAAYAGKLELKPGARALLERCRRRGWDMAVLTSCMPELCRAALERHGIADWFRGVVTTQETGLEKRDPALYRLAAALLQPLGEDQLSTALSGLASSMLLLFAVLAISGLFSFFAIALVVGAGNLTMMLR